MNWIDSRTLPVELLKERRWLAVKVRLDGVSLNEMGEQERDSTLTLPLASRSQANNRTVPAKSTVVAREYRWAH